MAGQLYGIFIIAGDTLGAALAIAMGLLFK